MPNPVYAINSVSSFSAMSTSQYTNHRRSNTEVGGGGGRGGTLKQNPPLPPPPPPPPQATGTASRNGGTASRQQRPAGGSAADKATPLGSKQTAPAGPSALLQVHTFSLVMPFLFLPIFAKTAGFFCRKRSFSLSFLIEKAGL